MIPDLSKVFAQGQQSGSGPNIKSVVRLQMYGGWDIALSCDPPKADRHKGSFENNDVDLINWNFPSGVIVSRSGIGNVGNDKNADAGTIKKYQ